MDIRHLLLLTFVVGASAGPISSGQAICATSCVENAKFSYEPGKTYEYTYTAETTSQMQGASEETAGMYITATANVEVNSPCDMTLKVSAVTLEESDPVTRNARRVSSNSADLRRHLEARPLHFSFQDGRVESLCAEEEDPEWVLNIKRGVLSALQNSMDHLNADHIVSEVDVAGRCEASYRVSRGFTSTTISKSKDLLACSERSDPMSAFKATPYQANSNIQSLPVVKSSHDCEQTISGGLISRSECHETHVLRPFSNQASGAVATTRHSLELQSQRSGVSADRVASTRRTDLLFNHEVQLESSSDRSSVDETLRQVCSTEDIRPETPALFSQLISQLRDLDETTLRAVRKDVNAARLCSDNHDVAKKFVHDALPMLGTGASVSIMTAAVTRGHVTGKEADAWMSSLAFVNQPKLQMIRSVQRLLTMENPSTTALLSSTALVNTFCLSRNCETHADAREVARMLAQKLGHHCQYQLPAEKQQILTVLKSLGNLGISSDVSEVLARCASNTENDADIRVAALDAFRRMSCSANERSEAMTLFSSTTEDSEIRIAGYLAAMRCPTETRLSDVRQVLASEEVNQVGSFVWTHLTNLMETEDQFKSDIRAILEDAQLQKEFNMDARKFSRNYDASYFSPTFNTGSKAEGNLIWSQSSFVPRSANLNLTVDIFGNSLNLFEVGGRVEGMETLLESMFGPEGYFPDTAIADALTRAKRSVEDDRMDTIRSQFATPSTEGPSGSMYMRMFGNELSHTNFDSSDNTDSRFNFLEMLIQMAQGGTIDLSKNVQFLDTSITLPTVLGVPLRLAINGTASVSLQAAGKIDLRQALSDPRNIDIDGYVKPSGAVEITSMMTMDATVMKTGLKMTSVLHSSTQANVQLQLQDGQVLNAKVEMPRQRQEIVSLTTRVFLLAGSEQHEQALVTEGRVEKEICTGERTSTITGLQLCGTLSYPNASLHESAPFYPLTGPLTAALTLEKTDDFAAYMFEASFLKERNHGTNALTSLTARLGFNTPGSRVNRELLLDFSLDPTQKAISAELRSPWKTALLTGYLNNEENLKRANIRFLLDGIHESSLDAQLHRELLANGVLYTPSVELRIPGKTPITLQGQFTHKPSELVAAELTLNDLFSSPILIKGSFGQELSERSARIENLFEVRTPFTDVKGSAFLEMNRGLTRGEGDLVYTIAGNKERMSASMRLKRINNRRTYRNNLNWEMTSTQFPAYNLRLLGDFKHVEGQMDTTLDLRYSGDLDATKERLSLTHTATYGQSEGSFTMNHQADFSYKPLRIAIDGKLNHMHSTNEVRTRGILNYMDGQRADMDIQLTRSSGPLGLSADLSLNYPGRQMRLTDLLETRGPQMFHHEMMVQWQEGSSMTTTTDIGKQGDRYELSTDIQAPSMSPVVFTGSFNPNPVAMDTSASLQVNGITYSGAASYNYRHLQQLTWNLDLQHPQRHVTSQGDISRDAASLQTSMELKWDADNDASQKVSLVGSLTYSTAGFSGQGKLTYPGDRISMALDHERQDNTIATNGQVSWSRGKRIHVHHQCTLTNTPNAVELISSWQVDTPFTGLETLHGSLNYNQESSQNNLETSFQWAEGQAIQVSLQHSRPSGWLRTRNLLTITTPFQSIQNMQTRFNYNVVRNMPRVNLDVTLNENKVVDLDLSGSKSSGNGEISFLLQTPVSLVRNIRINGQYSIQGSQATASAVAQFKRSRFEADFNSQYSNGLGNGRLVLKNPFSEDIIVEGSHNLAGNQYVTAGNIQLGSEPVISGRMEFVASSPTSSGQFRLSTPFTQAQQVNLDWSHSYNNGHIQVTSDLTLNDNNYKLDIGHAQESSGITADIHIETPHAFLSTADIHLGGTMENNAVTSTLAVSTNGAQILSLETSATLDRYNMEGAIMASVFGSSPYALTTTLRTDTMPYQTHMEITWDRTQRIAVDGQIDVTGLNAARGSIQVETPIAGFERTSINLNHMLDESTYTTTAQLQYGASKVIEANTNLNIGGQKSLTVDLMTPCPYIRRSSLSLTNNMLSATHESDSGRSTFESSITTEETGSRALNVRLTSPLSHLEDITLNLNHNIHEDDSVYEATLNLSPSQRMTSELRFATNGAPKLSYTLTTPFDALRNVMFGINHQGSSSNFNNNIDIVLVSEHMSAEVSSSFHINGVSAITGTARITGPLDIEIDVAHALESNGIATSLELTYASDKYGIALNGNNNPVSASLRVYTPCDHMRDVTLSIQHQGGMTEFTTRSNAKLITAAGTSTVEATVDANGINAVSANVEINSHMLSAGRITSLFSHTYQASEATTTVSFANGNSNYNIENQINMAEQRITLTIRSPIAGYERLYTSASFGMVSSEYQGHVEMHLASHGQITGDIRMSSSPAKLAITIETPFEIVQNLQASFQQSGSLENFNILVDINHNLLDGRIAADIAFAVQASSLNTHVKLGTPFAYAENIDFSLSHNKQSTGQYVSSVTAEYANQQLLDMNSRMDFVSIQEFNGELSITTTLGSLGNLEFSGSHNGNLMRGTSEMEIRMNGEANPMSAAWNLESAIECSLNVESPIMEPLHISVSHQGGILDFTNHMDITLGQQETQWRSSFTFANTIEASVHISSPFCNAIDFNMQHTGPLVDFRHSSELTYGQGQRIHLTGTMSTSNGLSLDMHLTTTSTSFSNFAMSVTHTGEMAAFENEIRMSLDDNAFQYTGAFSLTNGAVIGNFMVNTPVQNFESQGVEFRYEITSDYRTSTALKYGQKQIVVESSFGMADNIQGRLTVTTPQELMEHLDVTFSHAGGLTRFEHNLRTSYGSQTVDYTGSFSMENNRMTGNFEVRTPIAGYEDLSMEFQNSWASDYTSTITARYGTKQFIVDGSVALRTTFESHLSITAPAEIMPKLDVTFQLRPEFTNFNMNGRVTMGNRSIYSINALFEMEPAIHGNVVLTTPYENARSLELIGRYTESSSSMHNTFTVKHNTVEVLKLTGDVNIASNELRIQVNAIGQTLVLSSGHTGPITNFQNFLRVELNDSNMVSYNGQLVIAETYSIQGEVTTAFPTLSQLSIRGSHQGGMTGFNQNLEIKHNQEVVVDYSSNINIGSNEIQIQANVLDHSVVLTCGHSGLITNFNNFIRIDMDNINLISYNGELALADTYNMQVQVTTAFPVLSQFSVLGSHQGGLTDFQQSMEIKLRQEVVVDYSSNANIGTNEARIQVNAMGHNVVLTTGHTGPITNFQNSMRIDMDNTNLISYNGELALADTYSMRLEVTTAFPALSQFSIRVSHHGGMMDFQQNMEIKLGHEMMVDYTGEMTTQPNFHGKINLATSYQPISNLVIIADHSGSLLEFSNNGNVQLNRRQIVSFVNQLTVSGSSMDVSLGMTTAFNGLSQMSLIASHRGQLVNPQQALEIKFNHESVVSYNMEMTIADNFHFQAQLSSTKFGLSGTTLTISHNGNAIKFNNNLSLLINGARVLSAANEIDLETTVSINMELHTTSQMVRQMSISAGHGNGRQELVIKHNDQSVLTYTGELNIQNGLAGRAHITYGEHDATLTVSHQGGPPSLTTSANIQLNGRQMLALTTTVDMTQGISIDAEMQSSCSVVSQMSVQADLSTGHHQVVVKYNTNPVFTYTGDLSFANGVEAHTVMTTFYGPLSRIAVDLTHNGGIVNFNTEVSIQLNGNRLVDVSVGRETVNRHSLSAEIRTMFDVLSQASILARHENGEQVMEVKYKDTAVFTYNGEFNLQNAIEVRLEFATMYEPMSQLIITLSHNGGLINFHSAGSIQVNGERLVSVTLTTDMVNKYSVVAELRTRFSELSQASVMAKHENGRQEIEMKYNEQILLTYAGHFSLQNGLRSQMQLTTSCPSMSDLTVTFNHNGGLLRFNNEGRIQLNGQTLISVSSVGDMTSDYSFELELRTSYAPMSHAGISLRHQGNIAQHHQEMEITLYESSLFKIETECSLMNGVRSQLHLTTAMAAVSDLLIAVEHTGAYRSNAHVRFNEEQIFSITSAVSSSSPFSIDIEMSTAYAPLSQVSTRVSAQGSLTSSMRTFEFNLNGDRLVDYADQLTLSPTLQIEMTINTALQVFENFVLNINHAGDFVSFRNNGFIQLNHIKLITASTEFSMASGLSGSLSLDSSAGFLNDIQVSFSQHKGVDSYTAHVTASKSGNVFVAQVTLGGQLSRSQVSYEISYNGEEVIRQSNSLDFTNGFNMEHRLTTAHPILSEITIQVEHSGSLSSFQTTTSVTYNQERICSLEVQFDTLAGRASLESLIPYLNNVEAAFNFHAGAKTVSLTMDGEIVEFRMSHNGQWNNFVNSFELTHNDGRVVSYASELRLTGPFKLHMQFAYFDSGLNIQADHEGSFTRFTNSFVVHTNNMNVVTINSRFDLSQLSASINSQSDYNPLDGFTMSFSHETTSVGFVTNAVIGHQENTFELSLDANFGTVKEVRVSYRTPFAAARQGTFILNHRSLTEGLSTRIELSGVDAQNMFLDIELQLGSELSGTIRFSSPYEIAQSVSLTCTLGGTMQNFHSNIHFRSNYYGDVSLQSALSLQSPITLSFSVASDHLKDVSFEFSANGGLQNVQSSMTMTIQDIIEVQTDASFRTTPRIEGRLEMRTNWQDVRSVVLSFNHEGSLLQFTSQMSLSHNGQQAAQITAEIQTSPSIMAQLSIQSQLSGLENLRITVTHSGMIADFNSGLEIEYQSNTLMASSITFTARPVIEGTFTLSTSMMPLRDIQVHFMHEGSFLKFKTVSSVTLNGERQGETSLEFDVTDGITLSLNVTSPVSTPIILHVRHQGDLANFLAEMRMGYNGQECSIEARFNLSPSLNGQMQITTPFESMRTLSVEFTHQGHMDNFQSSMEVVYNSDRYGTHVAFGTSPNIEGTIRLTTPCPTLQDVTLELRHQGNINNFQTDVSLTYGQSQTIVSKLAFSVIPEVSGQFELTLPSHEFTTGFRYTHVDREHRVTIDTRYNEMASQVTGSIKPRPLELNVQITTPFSAMRDFSFSGSVRRGQKMVQGLLDMRHNNVKLLHIAAELKKYGQTRGSFRLETPVQYMEEIAAAFTLAQDNSGSHLSVSLTFAPGETLDGTLRLQSVPAMQGEFTLTTPITGFESIRSQVSLYKNDNDVGMDAELSWSDIDSSSISIRFSQDPTFQGSVTILTPLTEEIASRFNFDVTGNTMTFTTESSYGSDRFSYRFTLQAAPSVEGHMQIETPFPGMETMEFSFHCEQRDTQRMQELSASFGQSANYQFTLVTDFGSEKSVRMNIQTPHAVLSDVTIYGTFQKSANGMSYHFDLTNGQTVTVGHDLTLTLSPYYEFTTSLQTPHLGLERTTVAGKLESSANSIRTEFDLSYNNGQQISSVFTYEKSGSVLRSTFEMSTPCQHINDLGVTAEYVTTDSTKSPSFALRYNHREIVNMNADISLPTHLSVSVTTPLTGYETIRLVANNNENDNRYEPSVVLSWNEQRVQVSGTLVRSGSRYNTRLEGMLEVNTPWSLLSDARLQADHTSGRGSLTTRVNGRYNQRQMVDFEIQTSQEGTRRSANLVLRSPIEFTGSSSLEGSFDTFTANVDVTVDGQTVGVELQRSSQPGNHNLVLKVNTPTRSMEASSALESAQSRLAHTTELTWDKTRSRTVRHSIVIESHSSRYNKDYSIQTRLDTPLRSFEVAAGHQKTSGAMTTSVSAFWDAASDRTKKVALTNRFEQTAENYVHEITVSYPGAERDIWLHNELGINTAGKVFSSRSELQYSNDPSRHVVLSASLTDITTDGMNYTLQLGVSHPISQLDVELVSSIADSPSAMAAAMEMNYLNVAQQRNNMRLRGEIQKLRKRINMEMQSALKSYRLDGKLLDNDDHVTVRLVATSDNERQVSASLDLNSADNTLDLKAYMDPENQNNLLHMIGKYTPTSVAFDAYHQEGDNHVSDAEVDLEVRDSRLVYSKLFWRPTVLADIKAVVAAKVQEVKTSVQSGISMTTDFLANEIAARRAQIPEMPSAAAFISTEGQSLMNDWQTVVREAQIMYENNEFYIQNINAGITRVCSAVCTAARQLASHTLEHMTAAYEVLSTAYESSKLMMQTTLAELKQTCVDICSAVLRQYQEVVVYSNARWQAAKRAALERAVDMTQRLLVEVGPYADAMYNTTSQYARVAYDYVSSHPYVMQAQQAVSQVDLMAPLTDAHVSVSNNLRNMSSAMTQYIDATVQSYVTAVRYASDVAVDLVQEVAGRPEVRYMLTFVQNTTAQIQELYSNVQFEESSRQALEDFLTSAAEAVKQNAAYMVENYLQLDQDRLITWAPSEGLVEFQFYVPMDLPEFRPAHLRIPNFREIYLTWKTRITSLIPDLSDVSPWDYYYQYKPTSDVSNWIPPFKSYALIGGRQHLMTFDRTFYDFSSPCSHVLAGDHVTGQWSLMTGPAQDEADARSLVFKTGQDTIVVSPDYRVLVNGEQEELPVDLTFASVQRNGNVLSVVTSQGVSLNCDITHDVCRLDLPGWQFGKTGGLLGTFNNEPVDDMSAPDGRRLNSMAEFAASWAVNEACAHPSPMAPAPTSLPSSCRDLFNDSYSPFRPCYRMVDPTHFLHVCANETARHPHDEACKSATMYVQACAKAEVQLPMPAQCARCDADMSIGDVSVPAVLPSADVVFVVEEASCNQDMQPHLRSMAIKMETMALRSLGMKNNLFGLVGFGGEGAHSEPHSHTINGELMGGARTFRRTLRTFNFADSEVAGDVYAALRVAASYPFRAGASKSVILATCSQSSPADDIEDLIQELGISVHVLRTHDFQVQAGATPRTSRLFGVDGNTAFTSDHVSDDMLTGDTELYQRIAAPSDGLTQLAHSSGGTLFDVSHLTSGRVAVQKRFVDVFVRRVAKSAVPPTCQTCSCEPSGETGFVTVCRPCPGAWPTVQFPAHVANQEA